MQDHMQQRNDTSENLADAANDNRDQAVQIADEIFHVSKNSPLGKIWRWMRWSIFFVAALVMASGKVTIGSMIVAIMVIEGMMKVFTRQLSSAQPAVTLGSEGITSRLFSGKTKYYPWTAIKSISAPDDGLARRLQFELQASLGFADKRDFWTGLNHARPFIALNVLAVEDQERLFDAISRHLRQLQSQAASSFQIQANPFTEERLFQARLRSFAPLPVACYGLIVVNCLVWLETVVMGAGLLHTPAEKLLVWGGNAASEVQRGEWWRLLTATFLHGGLPHVAFNMIGLASAGVMVERIYGRWQFLLLYLGSGMLGSGLSLHFSAQRAVAVGASGAVFGIAGALLIAMLQQRERLPKLLGKRTISALMFYICYALVQGFSQQGIDNSAHVGGLLGGCLLAYILPERLDIDQFRRYWQSRAVVGLGLTIVIVFALVQTAPRAAVDQKALFEGYARSKAAFLEFDSVVKALQREQAEVVAGKLGEKLADERSRTVFAPRMRRVVTAMAAIKLQPNDPLLPVLEDFKRTGELMLESLEMASVYQPGSDKPEPAEPKRAAAIEAELKQIAQRMEKQRQMLR